MKRIYIFALTIIMALSLAACSGVDKTAVTNAFNEVSDKFDAIGTLVNENIDVVDAESIAFLTELGDALLAYKTEIESKDLTQERADEIVALLDGAPEELDDIKASVEAYINNANATITAEQQTTLDQLGSDLIDIGYQYDEYYESLNDESKQFVDDLAATVVDIVTVLEEKSITVAQADELIAGVQEQLQAAQNGLTELQAAS